MNKKIYVLLVAVVMIAFPLFAGWIPFFGEFIPKVAIMLYVALFAPRLMKNKAFVCLLMFYLYIILQSISYGYGFDFITWFATFMNFALPIFLLQAAITYDNNEIVKGLAFFSFIYIFVVVILSLIVMVNDPTALRQQQAMIVNGEMFQASQYRKQGLASYSFAAMIMCMPAVLISIFKSTSDKKVKTMAAMGAVLCLFFMWMGQVTTTFLICIALTFASLFVGEKSFKGMFVGIAIFIMSFALFGGRIIEAVRPYTADTAMEQKFDMFSTMSQGGEADMDEGSRIYLAGLTWKVFANNPIIGDPHGYVGGHNYFLDRLAFYGLVGVIPFVLMNLNLYRMVINFLPKKKHFIFKLLLMGFIALGFLKNMSGLEYGLFMFCFYPFILKYSIRFHEK